MTETDVRINSAEIRVKEAELENEAAPIRTKIAELQGDLQRIEERRAALRMEEALLYRDFTKVAAGTTAEG